MTRRSYPTRKALRHPAFDYTQRAAYFVTVVVEGRAPVLGGMVDGDISLNDLGAIADRQWRSLPTRFPGLVLDEHVVMPNHIHGLVPLPASEGGFQQLPLSAVVRTFKAASTFLLRKHLASFAWQRSFHDRIVGTEAALAHIRNNPSKWAFDHENPAAVRDDGRDKSAPLQ